MLYGCYEGNASAEEFDFQDEKSMEDAYVDRMILSPRGLCLVVDKADVDVITSVRGTCHESRARRGKNNKKNYPPDQRLA